MATTSRRQEHAATPTPTGLRRIHARSCPRRRDPAARCTCTPTWEAAVYDAHTQRKIRRQFKTIDAARAWRADTTTGLNRGTLRGAHARSAAQLDRLLDTPAAT